MTCLQRSHYIVFITFLKENRYKILLCIVDIFQSDVNALHDFPAHNSSNLVVTVQKPSHLGKHAVARAAGVSMMCGDPGNVSVLEVLWIPLE